MSAKRTTKQGSRSRRKRSREPRGQVVSVDRRGAAASIQLILPLRAQLADLRGPHALGDLAQCAHAAEVVVGLKRLAGLGHPPLDLGAEDERFPKTFL